MIRLLSIEDADAYFALRTRALTLFPQAFCGSVEDGHKPSRTRSDLAQKHDEDFVMGYFSEGQLLGTLGLLRHTQIKKRHKAVLWGMFVDPTVQGRGVGRALLAQTIKRARALPGLESLHLSVTAPSRIARDLYSSFGFEAWGTEVGSIKVADQYVDEIFMRLDF